MDAGASTIAAIATPPGPARRGIVRVSGPSTARLVRAALRDASPAFDPACVRLLARGRFDDGRGLQPVTLLWMRGPRSFTREDVAEFHLPGAEPLLDAALRRLLALGASAARPGEFTRRAFLNGRLDLSRAEGVLALTEAGNEAERAAAALLLDGGLDRRSAAIRERLLELATLCEASLDFDESETGHVPRAELRALFDAAEEALAEARSWELRRAAPAALARVLLAGAPNAGKSTLWNALTGGRALVSDEPGTTRDALEGEWSLRSFSCLLIDGPGLEDATGGPGARAQELFARTREQADLVLWVADATRPVLPPATQRIELIAWNKIDLPAAGPHPGPSELPGAVPVLPVSARSGAGLAELARAVARMLGGAAREGGAARVLFARHREALARAGLALAEARELFLRAQPLDLTAEALRASLAALDQLSGRTTPEDVLERIFARFCLGK
jgi:tRNA modification GTPase